MTAKDSAQKIVKEVGKSSVWWEQVLPPALLSIITFLIYYPSFGYPFQFDDIANITKFYHIRIESPFSNITRGRWFSNLLNSFNYKIGRFDPFYYRMTNTLIHILAGIAVFFLVFNICKLMKKKAFFLNNASLLATFSAGLFLLHPVQTQTVSYVIQARLEGVAGLFVLASLCFFIGMFRASSKTGKAFFTFLFAFFSFLSCATKEIVVVIPLLAVLIDWLFISQEKWSVFKKHLVWYMVLSVGFLALIIKHIGLPLFWSIIKMKGVVPNNRGNILTDHALHVITMKDYVISQFKVVWHYFMIFFWPFGISVEYDWRLSRSFWAPDSLFPFLGLVTGLSFIFYNLVRKRWTALTFGVLWFFISVFPRSFVTPAPELVCDYKSYLASVGVFFMISVFMVKIAHGLYAIIKEQKILEKFPHFLQGRQQAFLMIVLILLAPVGYAGFVRNGVWESSEIFWADCAKKAPTKARVHNNHGVALAEAGKLDEAISAYKKAIALDHYYEDPLSNIAVAYSMKDDLDSAIAHLKQAICIRPHYPEAHNNLGSLYTQQKKYELAEKSLKRALELRPWYGKANYNLARLAELQKDKKKVWQYLKAAVEGDLDIPQVFAKYGMASMVLKKYDEAEKAFSTIVKRGKADDEIWFNLGNCYFMKKQYEKAQKVYAQLVKNNPVEVKYAFNLAESLYMAKDYGRALEIFKRVVSLPNTLAQAFLRLGSCLEQLKRTNEAKDFFEQLLKLPGATGEFKRVVSNEITRLSLQSELKSGKGSIKLSKLNNIIKKNSKNKTS